MSFLKVGKQMPLVNTVKNIQEGICCKINVSGKDSTKSKGHGE
jgi:hypothetical protein